MKILSVEKVYKGFLSILKLKVETSKGEVIEREVMTRGSGDKSDDAVAALVYDMTKKKFIFVKQFRSGLYNEDNQSLLEVVAGTLEVGEDPTECIKREIEEEIGYTEFLQVRPCGVTYVSPGGTSEKIYLFAVIVANQTSEGGGLAEEHEEIEVVEMTRDEVDKHFLTTGDNSYMDMKTKLLVRSEVGGLLGAVHTINRMNKNKEESAEQKHNKGWTFFQ